MKLLTTTLLLLLSFNVSAQNLARVVIENPARFPSSCENDESLSEDEKLTCSTKEMLKFIYGNLVYPESAQIEGLVGVVKIKILIDEYGFVLNPTISKSLHPTLDKEALAVIKKLQEETIWIPAQSKAGPVQSHQVIYVRFGQKAESALLSIPEVLPRFPSSCEEEWKMTEVEKKKCADQEMYDYVYNRLVYPLEVQELKLKGIVIIHFTINEYGKMFDLRVGQSLHPILDEAVMKVIRRMQEQITWIPKQKSGKPVAVEYSLPIRFHGL